jgi:hypothetical protein
VMDENVRSALTSDEAKALRIVEPLHSTSFHLNPARSCPPSKTGRFLIFVAGGMFGLFRKRPSRLLRILTTNPPLSTNHSRRDGPALHQPGSRNGLSRFAARPERSLSSALASI